MAHSSERTNLPPKPCAACGRPITWRKKWARDWDAVKFCSDACRRSDKAQAATIEAMLLTMLSGRDAGASLCPSEVARRLRPDGWRGLMEPVRQAARRLALSGAVEVTQGGRVVDAGTTKGPIRVRQVEQR